MSKRPEKKNNGENQNVKKSRFLITVNVVGSAGPIRFVVNEDDLVSGVIDTALKTYAREGRLPVLGSDAKDFLLYCANAESDALSPLEKIGSHGGRNFVLCKKQRQLQMTERKPDLISHKGVSSWKAWLYRVLYF
ncbi:hypothetical protein FNV43_RR14913 [Rhamnella rubrinervis]|uniref:DUF7054 domain-containing protein n=1 Tax=Rhamnella rubrinervis TaxID=2594499 RepID=A0A8K0MG93_9ROSA|nr:hypothetical protein FNV43_RR14913 [Rhamnella rubrinervis]